MTFGPITINRPGASATVGIMGPIGKPGTPGLDGAPGPQGPAVFTPLTAWASGTTYSPATETSAASYVSIGGSSYACTTLHTSGIFLNDLGLGLWEAVGSKGDKGDAGTPGSVWYEGGGAPAAAIGLNGDYFLRTDTYDVLIKVSGAWTVIGNLKGLGGNTILSGTGAPANTIGNNGDFYLDTTSSAPRLYGPKANGAWPASGISLIGSGAGSVNPTGTFAAGDIVAAASSDGKTIQDTGLSSAVGGTPLGNGTAGVGVATTLARSDHVHPTDTSRAAAAALTAETTRAQAAEAFALCVGVAF